MSKGKAIAPILLLLSLNVASSQIVIDGKFNDWTGVVPYVTNSDSNSVWGANGTLTAGYYTAGDSALYLRTDVRGTFQPVDWDHYYIIYIDVDRSSSTGYTAGWWTIGADYRIIIFNSVQYIQKFMGVNQTDDSWGWDTLLNNSKAITAAFSGGSCELAVSYSDLHVSKGDSVWLQWRAEPGTNAMPAFSYFPRKNAYLNPTGTGMKMMVPAYFYPGSDWDRMAVQAAKMPGQFYAIVNVNSGPGYGYDASYGAAIKELQNSGGKVVGYVSTQYGARPIDSVKSYVDRWYSFYPSINGIFVDELPNVSGKEGYYLQLYNYIKGKDSTSLVVGNPGTNTVESYLIYNGQRVTDVLCIYEDSTGFSTWTPASWCSKYSRDNFLIISYNMSGNSWVNTVKRAQSLNIGWIYCTDLSGVNPYAALPSYFEQLSTYLATGVVDTIFVPAGNQSIKIDGHFSDWENIKPLNVSQNLPPGIYSDQNANITNVWGVSDSTNLYLSYQVSGSFDYTKYYYHVFVDTDNDSNAEKTGFVYQDSASIGAEFMIENNNLWKYNGSGHTNWSWVGASGLQKADSGGRTEIAIPLKVLFSTPSSNQIRFFIEINQSSAPYSLVETAPANYKYNSYRVQLGLPTDVHSLTSAVPVSYQLYQNYPNPFNPSTVLEYELPVGGYVKVLVFNVLGAHVATLVDGFENAGVHRVIFNAKGLPSGVYLYTLRTNSYWKTRKMLLLK